MAAAERWLLLLTLSLVLCIQVLGQAGYGNQPRKKQHEQPQYQNYNFRSYQVEPQMNYDSYDRYVDYEDDPRLDQSTCNYTQADICRTYGFTNMTELDEAGTCRAHKQNMGHEEFTHECTLTSRGPRGINYCCCVHFDQAEYANYTLLMCCKRTTDQRGVYACNNFWNTVDQINEYDDYGGSACSLAVQLTTLLACVLLTTSWTSEHR